MNPPLKALAEVLFLGVEGREGGGAGAVLPPLVLPQRGHGLACGGGDKMSV